MHRVSLVANSVMGSFRGLADWLYGCSHRSRSFPITIPAKVGEDGRQFTPAETYVVCLECGRHFSYDWTEMRLGAGRPAWARSRPELDRVRSSKGNAS